MKCASYPKKPFKHTKMECKCTSNSRFKVFKNLKELIQNGPKPMDLLFKSCSWYDASNKKSKTAVIPINGKLKCHLHSFHLRKTDFTKNIAQVIESQCKNITLTTSIC